MAMTFGIAACARTSVDPATFPSPPTDIATTQGAGPQTVILAGGCFWCTEAVFESVPGVISVESGYAGGTSETANYKLVSAGATDHAEAIKVTYDPARISYGQVLKVFFAAAHDPTTLNRQGPDHGRHYRSAIFYQSEQQADVARKYIAVIDEARVFDSAIVTTLEKLDAFYPAEQFHQDYVRLNPGNPYIQQNVPPKLTKLEKLLKAQAVAGQSSTTAPATSTTTKPAE
jgi:peptide-methionine (S)-S-oxide reductase